MTTVELGAPDQEEIAAYQRAANDAQMAGVRASAKVAEYEEALAYARAELAATNTTVAKLNVTGAELQARLQFAKAAAGTQRLVASGPVPGLRK
jgi:hypothetical protein